MCDCCPKYPLPNRTWPCCLCPRVPCCVATPTGCCCGFDPVTIRRPIIVGDSCFDYRPTSCCGKLLDVQDKHVRYMLINQETCISTVVHRPCGRSYCRPMKYIATKITD